MGLQLIICVETDSKCKSDYIYIKNTIEQLYKIDYSQQKLTPIYLGGKDKYSTKPIDNKIRRAIKDYGAMSNTNNSVVLLCFDCDNYDSVPADAEFLKQAERYCTEKCYQFVWFCKDIEQVYLGERIENSKKKQAAERFQKSKKIRSINPDKLATQQMKSGRSNICNILDAYLTRRDRYDTTEA